MSELNTIEQPALEFLLTRFLAQDERAMLDHLLPWFLAQNLPEPLAALVIARMQGGQAAPLVSKPLAISAPLSTEPEPLSTESPAPDLSIPPSITPELTAELTESRNSDVNSRNGKTGRPLSMSPKAVASRRQRENETPEQRARRLENQAKADKKQQERRRAERAARNGSEPAAPAGEEGPGADPAIPPEEWEARGEERARDYILSKLAPPPAQKGGQNRDLSAARGIEPREIYALTGWDAARIRRFIATVRNEQETAQRQQKGGASSLIEAIYGEESEEEVAA